MAGEFTKPSSVIAAVTGTIANPDEYNQNIAAQSKDSVLFIDVDGNLVDGDVGDNTLGSNGSMVNDIYMRDTGVIKLYNSSNVYQNDVNLGQATESALGQAEIATEAEVETGTDDLKFITPLKLRNSDLNLQSVIINDEFRLVESTATISSGVITYSSPFMTLDTQSAASEDELDSISGGSTGDYLLIRPANASRDIIIKNGGGIYTGTGTEIRLCAGVNYATLIKEGGNWIVTSVRTLNSDSYFPISSVLISNDSVVDFDLTGYDSYEFVLDNVVPSTNVAALLMRVSTDGGSTFKSGASDYRYSYISIEGGTVSGTTDDANNAIDLTKSEVSDTSSKGITGIINTSKLNNSKQTTFISSLDYAESTADFGVGVRGNAAYEAVTTVNAVRFYFSSGNLSSGRISVFGKRNFTS